MTVYAYLTEDAPWTPDSSAVAWSDVAADGSYALTGLEAGSYKLHIFTYGAGLAEEWWAGDADAFDDTDAQPIAVAGGDAVVADAALENGAVISGIVRGGIVDWGYGWVLAYRLTAGDWWNEGYADIAENGTYTVDGLRPGTYKLMFSDSGGYGEGIDGEADVVTGWQEWWNDAMTLEAGTAITLTKQQVRSGTDVDLNTVAGQKTWPAISGTPKVGVKLTAAAGAWPTGSTLKYRWYANGEEIVGATSSTFTPTAAHLGKRLEVGVFGLKPGSGIYEMKFSGESASVGVGSLSAPAPTISGAAAVGSTLTAKPGTWTSGTTLSYQWYANGAKISTATRSTFKVTATQKAKTITVVVTGKKAGYATASKTSAKTLKVATVATPTVSGTKRVGSTLTAKPGTWTSKTVFTYQWYAAGKAIKGATKPTFRLTSAQRGKAITVKVTGKLSGYPTIAKTSAATTKVV